MVSPSPWPPHFSEILAFSETPSTQRWILVAWSGQQRTTTLPTGGASSAELEEEVSSQRAVLRRKMVRNAICVREDEATCGERPHCKNRRHTSSISLVKYVPGSLKCPLEVGGYLAPRACIRLMAWVF